MKRGKAKVRLERSLAFHSTDQGQIYLGVQLSIDIHYWKLYREACEENPADHVERLESALKMVVWGAMCLESLLNARLVQALKLTPKSELDFLPIWDTIRTLNWGPKFELLGRLVQRRPESIKKMRGRLQQVMDLRNRLVHFKDDPTPIDVGPLANKDHKLTPAEVFQGLVPEASIEKELVGDAVPILQRNVSILKKWIDKTLVVIAELHGKKVKTPVTRTTYDKPPLELDTPAPSSDSDKQPPSP